MKVEVLPASTEDVQAFLEKMFVDAIYAELSAGAPLKYDSRGVKVLTRALNRGLLKLAFLERRKMPQLHPYRKKQSPLSLRCMMRRRKRRTFKSWVNRCRMLL